MVECTTNLKAKQVAGRKMSDSKVKNETADHKEAHNERRKYVKPAFAEEETFQTFTLSCAEGRKCATGVLPPS
jgi:hypothetical protein